MSSGISEAPAAGIGKLLQDNRFIVPTHQRDYSWEETQVNQLFEDIELAIKNDSPVHFLGLMVFLETSNGHLIVLDGQQRLATVIIIFSAIRNWLQQYSEHASQAGKIQDWFIGRSELGEDELQPRLTMNIANSQLFNDLVIRAVALRDIKKASVDLKRHDPNRDMLQATIFAHERVAQMALDVGSSDQAAKYFFKFALYLRDNVRCVKLTVTSEEAAFTIFETLNDRGLDLSPLDLVKNHLFRCAKAQPGNRLREMEARWVQMMATLSNVKADSFLKAFWTSRHGRIRTSGLFEAFKRQYADGNKVLDLSVEMLGAAQQYTALDSPEDPEWAPFSVEARNTIRSLKLLGSQPAHPVMLAAMARMDVPEIERFLRLLEVLIVRYLLILGGNPGRLETSWAILARSIYTQETRSATQAFQQLKDFYPSDEEFENSFALKRESDSRKAQYYLKTLERQARRQVKGAAADELQAGPLSVEHVLPQHPGREWTNVAGSDEAIAEDCVFRLGNICLLTKANNKDLGRLAFGQKQAGYAGSDLFTTKELAEYEEWTRASIERRQKGMAKLAVQAWRFQ